MVVRRILKIELQQRRQPVANAPIKTASPTKRPASFFQLPADALLSESLSTVTGEEGLFLPHSAGFRPQPEGRILPTQAFFSFVGPNQPQNRRGQPPRAALPFDLHRLHWPDQRTSTSGTGTISMLLLERVVEMMR